MSARAAIRHAVAWAMACTALVYPGSASAQQKPAAPRPAVNQPMTIRGFVDLTMTKFAAGDTFKATLDSSVGTLFGGGVEVVLPQRVFVNLRISRFQKSGERVFVDEGEVFPLGIDMDVEITPVEVSAGYRFRPRGRRANLIPYVGGGIGWHRYSETSEFADTSEDVRETFTGYHLLAGAEYRLGRLFAVAGEGHWTTVPDALGSSLSSASNAFDETNLGGVGFRIRFIVGR